jgi:formyl-CoA transferase/CoA:oxalate CoA-transferase
VIKVERPPLGDDLRVLRGRNGMSASFGAINRNKRGIALDLQNPEGSKIAFELARRADVVVENFLPGVAARLGLGYEAVSAANPAVVYVSVTGFGQDGPHAKRPGYNTIAQGMSGLMALTGHPGDPPTRVAGSTSDLSAALVAFGSVCAALVHRFRDGRGQRLDVNLLASSLSLLPDPTAIFFDTGVKPRRYKPEPLARAGPTDGTQYHARDHECEPVGTVFCAGPGEPELEKDPRFTNADRISRYEEFQAYVTRGPARRRRLRGRALRGCVHRRGAGVTSSTRSDRAGQAPTPRVKFDQPGLGPVHALGFPARASLTPRLDPPPCPSPVSTVEVLRELGYAWARRPPGCNATPSA